MAGPISYDVMLRNKIQPTFIEYVITENVLHIFHQYDPRVLTEIDIDSIQAEATMRGAKQGTLLLLNRLRLYQGWFECLIQVLKDPQVRLQHVATSVEHIKAQLDLELTVQRGPAPRFVWTEAQNEPVAGVGGASLVDTPAVSDFSLSQTDSVASVSSMVADAETDAAVFSEVPLAHCIPMGAPSVDKQEPMSKDMPFKKKESKEKENTEEKERNSAAQQPSEPAAEPDVEGARAIFEDASFEDHTYDEVDEERYPSIHTYPNCGSEVPSEYAPPPPLPDISRIPGTRPAAEPDVEGAGAAIYDDASVGNHAYDEVDEESKSSAHPYRNFPEKPPPPLPDVSRIPGIRNPSGDAGREPPLRAISSHGVEYDYSKEEVTTALGNLPGWHSGIGEKEVWAILTPYIKQDGWYLFWYWDYKKRPAICVTERNTVKTLVIHKRPDPRDKSKIQFYFIDKAQKKADTLLELVRFHLQNGVKNMAKGGDNRLIHFRIPVLSQSRKF